MSPYGAMLIPAPVELGPRTLVRRVIVATIAATAAAMITTAALLVAQPSDLIPSGGELELFSSGAGLAEPPLSTPADAETERLAASRPSRPARATAKVVASRVTHIPRSHALGATPTVVTAGTQAP